MDLPHLMGEPAWRKSGESETEKRSLQSGACEQAGNHHGQLELNPRGASGKHIEHSLRVLPWRVGEPGYLYPSLPSVLAESHSRERVAFLS